MTTADQKILAERLRTDERFYIEKLIRIEDRMGRPIDFKLNPAQEILDQGATLRDLVVKASQLGITTWYLARALRKVMTKPGQTAVLVAHEEFLTQRLLQRLQVMYDSIPEPLKAKMAHSSSYEKTFPDINGVIYIGTAGAKVFGRGEPIHFFHGSEVAFWGDAWRILTPTMQRVPLDGTMVLESTPNGEGDPENPDPARRNAFYDLVQEAKDDPESIWKLHELNWWLEKEYRISKGSDLALPSDRGSLIRTREWKTLGDAADAISLTGEEVDLIRKAGWTDLTETEERLRWRRRKIKEIKTAFWQEFMEDLESCFLSSGLQFYDSEELERLRAGCYEAPSSWKNARVWYEPVQFEEHPVYHISVDPGQGKVTRSVATVWRLDLENFNQVQHVATLSGFYNSDAFAPMVKELGVYYHNAQIAAEANGHGASFCSHLLDYSNVYYRSDVVSGLISKQIGWMTTGTPRVGGRGTKPFMMGALNELLPILECHDLSIIREMMQVRMSGPQVKFLSSDDFHDSAAIMAGTRPGVAHRGQRGLVGTSGKWGR
jgi:hypothetical protein